MAAVAAHGRPRLWRASRDKILGGLVTAAGVVTGRVLRHLKTYPGLGGAVMVSVCAGELTSHVFGHGLAPWVAGLVGGGFLLVIDRRL